jgi:hypothetical protein
MIIHYSEILIGFQCGSGSCFFLGADPDPGSQTNADPTLKSQKVEFLKKVGNRKKILTLRRYKAVNVFKK